jgi:uncharacterized protein YjiS (DUF1127 family)
MTYLSLKNRETAVFETGHSFGIGLDSLMFILSILKLPRRWRERVQERRYLSELSDHVLTDIGLTRWDVTREAAKPFWRPLARARQAHD